MPKKVYKVEPPITLAEASLLIAVASNPNNGFRISDGEDPSERYLDMVEIGETEADALNKTFAGVLELVETDEEL